MNRSKDLKDITENFNKDKHLIFGYTPMCGTCKMSEKMLDIANEIVRLPVIKVNLNFHPEWSKEKEIMSVPVLLVINRDTELKRIYAFQSVPYLLENLK